MAIATLIRLVASYTVVAATGALSPQVLALKLEVYDHYQQVRDVWGRRAHPRRTLMRS